MRTSSAAVSALVTCAVLLAASPALGAPWSAAVPGVVRDVQAGRPLVVRVVVALCSNAQIDCGSAAAGSPGNLRTNLYWGAIFGARRFLERKRSGWERVEVQPGRGAVLERVIFRRWVDGTRWGLAEKSRVEELAVLDAVHGAHIDEAVRGFWQTATRGAQVEFSDSGQQRSVRVHVVGYDGHNRLMDGTRLPGTAARSPRAIPSFVLACYSASWFSPSLRAAGSEPLVMTRALMAPEGYVLDAVLRGLGDNESEKAIRRRAVRAYAAWQRLSFGQASRIFAPR